MTATSLTATPDGPDSQRMTAQNVCIYPRGPAFHLSSKPSPPSPLSLNLNVQLTGRPRRRVWMDCVGITCSYMHVHNTLTHTHIHTYGITCQFTSIFSHAHNTHTHTHSYGHTDTHIYSLTGTQNNTHTRTATQADWWLGGRVGLARGDESLLFQF